MYPGQRMVKLLTFALLIGSLVSLASAAPAPQSVPKDTLSSRDWIDDCGASTFENQTSGGSPTVADCLQLAANIAGGGTWTVELLEHHQLAQYGTCAFGVQGTFYVLTFDYRVGNSDIIDLIHDSVNRFQWYGKVGAKGSMGCQSDPYGNEIPVNWGIYHT